MYRQKKTDGAKELGICDLNPTYRDRGQLMAKYQNEELSVAQMRTGQTGMVVGVAGGPGLVRRLDAMGIRPGKPVTKISSTLFHGPITLSVNSSRVAIGFGMARRIIVKVDKYLP
jgi:ferrous iron transport protein A